MYTPTPPDAPPGPTAAHARGPQAERLLILDDEATIGELLMAVAIRLGFEARLCSCAASFFRATAEWSPTHLAIDLTMPDMSGQEVMRQLASDGCQARVIISSGAGREDINDALAQAQALGLRTAGALSKPFSLASVRALLTATNGSEDARRA